MINISSKLEIKLLSFFFVNEHKKLYLSEIARLLDLNPANLDKKLKRLEKQGVFLSEWQGKQKYYFLNKQFPLFGEYKSIINKTFGIESQMKISLKKVKNIREAFIFGSYAKGKLDQWSDIDLLIIGSHNPLSLSKIITRLEKVLFRSINIVELTSSELIKRKRMNDPLLNKIFSNKYIKLI